MCRRQDALTGSVYTPYDKEEDIYLNLMNELKTAANAIDLKGDTYVGTSDAVFAGNLLNWKKFANTLRLRLAIQISNGNSAEAQKVVNEVLADESNTIVSANETSRAFYGNTSNNWSYLYDYNIIQGTANLSGLHVISESLVQHMLPYNDPRLPIYAKPAAQGPFAGKYFGQPKATQLPTGVSIPGGTVHSSTGKTGLFTNW